MTVPGSKYNSRDRLALDPENSSKYIVEKHFMNSREAYEFKAAFENARFKGEAISVDLSCVPTVRKFENRPAGQ